MDHDWNRKSNRPFQNHITFPMKAAHPLRDISFLTFTSLPSFYHFQKKISNVVQLNWYQINFGGLSYVSFLLHNIGNFFRYISINRNANFSFLSLRWIVVLYFLQKDIFSGWTFFLLGLLNTILGTSSMDMWMVLFLAKCQLKCHGFSRWHDCVRAPWITI